MYIQIFLLFVPQIMNHIVSCTHSKVDTTVFHEYVDALPNINFLMYACLGVSQGI